MILLYHKVDISPVTKWWVSADHFYEQMSALKGIPVLSLSDYFSSGCRGVVITFDGVYENVYKYAYPILKHFGYPFELFVIGDCIGRDNSFDSAEPLCNFASLDQLLEMQQGGGILQWHTATHKRLSGLSRSEKIAEIKVPHYLKQFARENIDLCWFAYPHADRDKESEEIVKDCFTGALSVDNLSVGGDRYALPRVEVFEETDFKSALPTVSVIIPNYNYGRFVEDALESVFVQSAPPDEVLVIDDASSDGSDQILRNLSKKYDFELVINKKNLGVVDNFNKAVALTTGEFICLLGADNRFRRDYVERSRAALMRSPQIGVAYTDAMIFGPMAPKLAESVGAELFHDSQIEGYSYFHWRFPSTDIVNYASMKAKNYIHGSSMYRRAAYLEVGGYRKTNGPEDHDLFTRMLGAGWLPRHVDSPILEYRQHSAAQVNTVLNLQRENFALQRENARLRALLSQG